MIEKFFLGLLIIIIIVAAYFLPTLAAMGKKKKNTLAIFLLNLLLGWTIIGWVIAIIWAVTYEKKE